MFSNHYSSIRPPENNGNIDQMAEVTLVAEADNVLGDVSEREEDQTVLELHEERRMTRSMRRLAERRNL